MGESIIRAIKLRVLLAVRWLVHTRGVWLRGLLCWAIAFVLCVLDTSSKFDLRFQLRGPQMNDSDIVLVYLDQNDWTEMSGQDRNLLRPLKEISAFTDTFFWNPGVWQKLLSNLLEAEPLAIGVTFYFPPGSLGNLQSADKLAALYDPRVIWAARLDSDGRAVLPAFASSYGRNAGLIDFFDDDDGHIRRFSSPLVQVPHLAMRLAEVRAKPEQRGSFTLAGENRLINFQGPPGTYPSISARDFLTNPKNMAQMLKGKILIVGTKDLDGHIYPTPVGPLSRAELTANITDNVLGTRWIHSLPLWAMGIYLAILLILAIMILRTYPQAVAFVWMAWSGVGLAAISLWIFDAFYIWSPILAPIALLITTYVIFLGYQLAQQENLNWRLEQEKKYLQEIEQLKNNFMSLFSHDLKTPIAKIQAICDRLMAANPTQEIQNGLQSLRLESSELHRYIQSILRISRIESSDFTINKEPSDVNELIFKVCQQVKPLADAKKIVIDTNLEPIFSIEVDPTLIQEVILNLVENAIKYTPENGRVKISSQEVSDQVIVVVDDTGPGIAAAEQSRIFEKFYRGGDHSLSTKGSGLGLYLVKYFVELHGGRVFLRSEPNKGTRVGFTLPLGELPSVKMENVYGNDRTQSLDS